VSDRRNASTFASGSSQILIVPPNNPFYLNPAGGSDPVTIEYGFGSLLGPESVRADTLLGSTALGFQARLGAWTFRNQLAYSLESLTQQTFNAVDYTALTGVLDSSDASTAFDPFANSPNNLRAASQIRTTFDYDSVTTETDLLSYVQHPLASFAGG